MTIAVHVPLLILIRFWGFLYYQHRYDICKQFFHLHSRSQANVQLIVPVQNYITAILVFLVVEMLLTWGFYGKHHKSPPTIQTLMVIDFLNRNGSSIGSKVLLILVAILNAFRNSFSFFLLLIVCMGYGVVKPSLGKTMIYIRWLAIAHFVFGLVYAITSLLISPDAAGMLDSYVCRMRMY